jgi:hypothetical protein
LHLLGAGQSGACDDDLVVNFARDDYFAVELV